MKNIPAIYALYSGILFSIVFTFVIFVLGSSLSEIHLTADQGASWYYWKLAEPSIFTQVIAWLFYILHQCFLWGVIYYAQQQKLVYSPYLRLVNLIALAGNAFFISLHLVHTHLWYDALAQDVSIWSALASVAVMLIWVLLMENNRRGLFLGKQVPFPKDVTRFARKYHGYYFAWAIIYTFWYHPMIASSGHLIGFLYIFLLLLQSSLFFTNIHRNKFWTLLLEISVLFHGTLVAVMQGQAMASMFFFGFAGIFLITQMHGVNLTIGQRWAILGAYLLSLFSYYGFSSNKTLINISEVIRIPIIDYLGVFVLALILSGIIKTSHYLLKRGKTKH